jgi:dihydrolipoamide dehydrogenase
VCLNWGCIPSKALIAVGHLMDEIRGAGERGILVGEPRIDVAKLRAYKEGVVKKLVSGIGALEKGNGVEVVKGKATFVGPNAVEVEAGGERTRIEAPAFLLATGARPIAIPGFAYGKDVWSARDALDLPEVPGRLVVIGGGVIGLELGTVYAKLGSKVTIVEALPALLTGVDPEAVRIVQKGLRQRGVDVHVNAKAKGLEPAGAALSVKIDVGGEEKAIAADKILVAVGFRPNSEGLGLEAAGVQIDARGYVQVDEQLRSSNPAVFAIGDLVGPPFLAHKASKEGEIAAEVIAGHKSARDWVAMPGAIFTDPEVATVGLSEEAARARGLDPLVGKFAFAALGRAIAIDHTEGFVKVIADRESKVLLGVTMVGPEASALIAEATLALEMGAYVEDVALTVHAHPTLAEAFMEACKATLGEAIHALNRPERPKREKAGAPAQG